MKGNRVEQRRLAIGIGDSFKAVEHLEGLTKQIRWETGVLP